MALQSKGAILSRATEPSLFSVSLFLALALCVPWMPDFATIGMEPSWRLSLHYFFEHGFVFGKDIIFTYGPYGFISTYTYYPATYRVMFFAYLFFVTVYTVSGWDILRKMVKNVGLVFFAVFATSVILAPAPYNYSAGDTFFYTCGILFFASYLVENDTPNRLRNFFLVGIMAAASLMKYSFFMWAVGLLSFVSLDGIIFGKRIPFLFLLYWGTLAMLWVLARQPLTGLGDYFLTGAYLARYYGSAMSCPLASHYLSFILYLLLSVSFIAIFYIAQQRRTGHLRAILPSLTLAGMAFMILRAAFTRPDHNILAMSYLAILGVYVGPFLSGALRTKWWKSLLAVYLMVIFSLTYVYSIKPFDHSFPAFAKRIWNSISKMPYYMFVESRFLSNPKDLQRQYKSVQDIVKWFNPAPYFSGTVDAYPYDGTGLIAWGLQYKPRPTVQAYVAESPFLSRKNADYFKGPNAPEFLIFGPNITEDGHPVDGRYPTLDDSLSLLEITSRYDFLSILRTNALLKKSPDPRPYWFQPIGKVAAEFGKSISVPYFDKGPIWVEIDVETTWRGKIFEFLGRAGRPLITVRDRNGKTYTYELPPVMSQTGFLLSPVLDDPGGFIAFWTHHYENPGLFHKEVVEVKLEVPSLYKGFFVPKFEVRFSSLKT